MGNLSQHLFSGIYFYTMHLLAMKGFERVLLGRGEDHADEIVEEK